MSLESLPKGVKFNILRLLSMADLNKMQMVNKYWFVLVKSREFWMFKVFSDHGSLDVIVPKGLHPRVWYYICSNGLDILLK